MRFVVGTAKALEDEVIEVLLKEGMPVPREGRELGGGRRALHAENLA